MSVIRLVKFIAILSIVTFLVYSVLRDSKTSSSYFSFISEKFCGISDDARENLVKALVIACAILSCYWVFSIYCDVCGCKTRNASAGGDTAAGRDLVAAKGSLSESGAVAGDTSPEEDATGFEHLVREEVDRLVAARGSVAGEARGQVGAGAGEQPGTAVTATGLRGKCRRRLSGKGNTGQQAGQPQVGTAVAWVS
jgi:hypothetical protein